DNRNYHALTAWEKVERGGAKAEVSIHTEAPLSQRNPHYAVIDIAEVGDGAGLMNLGFNSGIAVQQGEQYLFTVFAKFEDDEQNSAPVQIIVETDEGAHL